MTVLTDVDSEFSAYYTALKSAQDTYFGTYGKYFQGLVTHSSIPQDGAEVTADTLSSKPTDQEQSWIDFNFTPGTISHTLRCDVVSTGSEHKWRAVIQVIVDGVLYERTSEIDSSGVKTDGDFQGQE